MCLEGFCGGPLSRRHESGFTAEGAGMRSSPALAPDNAGKGGGTEPCGGTGQRRWMERVKAMAHNVKVYDVGRQAHVSFSPGA